MNDTALQTILSIVGSAGAFLAVIIVCGYSINLVRLNYHQRDVLEHLSAARERYLLNGAAFVLFVVLVLVIGLGLLAGALQISAVDILGTLVLVGPVWINEYLLQRRASVRRHYILFLLYVSIGTVFLLLSTAGRLSGADWTTLVGVLSNAAFIGIQLIIFAIGWGVTAPSGRYQVDLKLESGEIISGYWLAQVGDEFALQVEDKVVAVRVSKVVSRTFH